MDEIKFEIIKKTIETNFKSRNINSISSLNTTSPPSIFVGSKLKYPLVNIGILSPIERDENAGIYDSPDYWAKKNLTIRDILNLRKNLLNSRFRANVNDSKSEKQKFIQISQELASSSKPVDVEIELKKEISTITKRDKILAPQEMVAPLKRVRVTGNVKIDRRVDKIMNDEIKAAEGISYLYENNFNEYFLSKVLSAGVIGLKKDRKFVPTRWSITATDDIIGKKLLKKIREYKSIENYELFFGEFLGNAYLIMFFPYLWSYELFEIYLPGGSWNPNKEIKASTDFEGYEGRKDYAAATGGGYYASKLPILEYLEKIKRQSSVLAIRIELPTYWAALGVWVVRESVRKALNKEKMEFSEMKEMIENVRKIGMIKWGFNSDKILKNSKLLENIKTQTTLERWF
ncbi:MAG: hypothetical protein QXU40_02095 [Candidatus Pacearchaeota archaeon]